MTTVKDYFASIATAATTRLISAAPPVPPGQAAIADTAQSVKAAAWQANAVHPMQVLETVYQAIVNKAGAAANSDHERTEREGEALSRFFSLGTHKPMLLELPDSSITIGLEAQPLMDARLRTLHAQLGLARSLIDEPSASDTPLNAMASFVKTAISLIVAIVPDQRTQNLPKGIEDAIGYLGLFNPWSPGDAAQNWLQTRQNISQPDDLREVADELATRLLRPLEDPANAAASVRALYNIKPFYLYRLLHRFHGGSRNDEMDYETKGKASGLVTEFMHPKRFDWLAGWHEQAIADLDAQLGNLDLSLQKEFARAGSVLRFYLKGGRALFTTLGDPAQGKNDWDTGILIDPGLSPEQWYLAMAAVNDTVIGFLDRARFTYTALLYQHLDELDAWDKQPTATRAEGADTTEFTRLAAIAEAEAERVPSVSNVHLLSEGSGFSPMMLGALAGQGSAPVGVNGELIDIGVPTRSSVELRELWRHLEIGQKPGVSKTRLPVPDLAYFVDDFSTIIRQAFVVQGPVDRKLAKRLERLGIVLASSDAALTRAVSDRVSRLAVTMPKTLAALEVVPDSVPADPADRLRVWTLAQIADSIAGDDPLARGPFLGALDAYASDLVSTGRLYDPRDTQSVWEQISDAFKDAADKGEGARGLLVAQGAAHGLATTIARNFAAREIALGVSGLSASSPPEQWAAIISVFSGLARLASMHGSGSSPFVITGTLAVRMQGVHAGLDQSSYASAWPVELIEAAIEVDDLQRAHVWLRQIATFLTNAPKHDVVGESEEARLLFYASSLTVPGPISEDRPVILSIRPVARGEIDPTTIDTLFGYPVLSLRELARTLVDRASAIGDYDLRCLIEGTGAIVTERILGRQL